ncbi:MAG: NUDIX hydrolase [Lentisphaerae bacterium]|nr:NUDIX hydrolase [Lentisphaerota bacterium]
MAPQIDRKETVYSGKFLACKKIFYTDARGNSRQWEAVDRTGSSGEAHAVFIVAKIVPDNELVLIRQFRPPAGKVMVEFPAGLIDPGESAETTAVRELYEETGFTGKVLSCSAGGYSSPGMTGESIILAAMEIDGTAYPDGFLPENHQEESENIEVFRVKTADLPAFIRQMESENCGIDSKIYTALAFREFGW